MIMVPLLVPDVTRWNESRERGDTGCGGKTIHLPSVSLVETRLAGNIFV